MLSIKNLQHSINFFSSVLNFLSELYQKNTERTYLRTGIVSILLALTLIAFSFIYQSYFTLLFASFLFGIANAGLRTSSILIGTGVTPSHLMHLIISASDSIIRPMAGLTSVILGLFVTTEITTSILISVILIITCICLLIFKNYNDLIKTTYDT